MRKKRLSAYLDNDVMDALEDYAARREVSLSLVAEAAIASFLSPDAADRREAAVTRRLDQIDRRVQRVERDIGIAIETIALFVRYWLSSTPALPEAQRAEARAKGIQRYDGFVDALGQRLRKGPKLRQEIADDVPPARPVSDADSAAD
ncbi:CopG family transcriptional regulator [Mesorhizobium sp. PUT5]|uniref:CopG family transcriptional regulator n=1 Tax=Mesorhizobium sp. PUT5 TaxID=3454629 RepID=UPI003FA425EA